MRKHVCRTPGDFGKFILLVAVIALVALLGCSNQSSKDISKLELVLGKKIELDGLSLWWDSTAQVIRLRYVYNCLDCNENNPEQNFHAIELPPGVLDIRINQDEIKYSFREVSALTIVDTLNNEQSVSIPIKAMFESKSEGMILAADIENYHDEDGKRIKSIPLRNYNLRFVPIPENTNADLLATQTQLTPPAKIVNTEALADSTAKIQAVFFHKADNNYQFIRFYIDGLVISTGYADKNDIEVVWPAVKRWFERDIKMPISNGHYFLDGDKIKFTLRGVRSETDYSGSYKGNELILTWHNLTNGIRMENVKYTRIETDE